MTTTQTTTSVFQQSEKAREGVKTQGLDEGRSNEEVRLENVTEQAQTTLSVEEQGFIKKLSLKNINGIRIY